MQIRRVVPDDLAELIALCRAHAAFEKSATQTPDADRLRVALFDSPARLHAWVAVDERGELIGYASATVDFSTWSASEFMHLDCLFVMPEYRGQRIGQQLIADVKASARALGLGQLQWQTPDWNVDAQRFYERLGAQPIPKVRYVLTL